MTDPHPLHHGSCLCGRVRFTVQGPLKPPDACHCVACRKSSGHFFVSTDAPRNALTVEGTEHIRGFQSSDRVRRGVCGHCGAPLFWDPPQRDWTGVAMGAFDTPTGTHTALHVFVTEKGDDDTIADGPPQFARVPG